MSLEDLARELLARQESQLRERHDEELRQQALRADAARQHADDVQQRIAESRVAARELRAILRRYQVRPRRLTLFGPKGWVLRPSTPERFEASPSYDAPASYTRVPPILSLALNTKGEWIELNGCASGQRRLTQGPPIEFLIPFVAEIIGRAGRPKN